ncbi:MAG: bifunctional DNA-formamidopyrimidine glycosylase/DNA-(apurinic or apyrimidinic site) lyase [bacterium]|nr:bifunctional DNA-formamidopyrimidine glycosylase/DNA-(apurinic or apyrimidinic site) lyase [Planctomycetota bacterium]HIL51466.1 bifunctional DNA-formamidopyrimidine glycosylase/DNA-(apurinic or apyrimidinic site) lyase [Planctomycetota bacterium]
MPELPEVETVARLVRPDLEGRRVRAVRAFWPRTIGEHSEGEFAALVSGARIARVWRRAKYIVLDLERRGRPAGQILVHLRMTGRLHITPGRSQPRDHERLRLSLEGGRALSFIDVRKFGRVRFMHSAEGLFRALGPEPLEDGFSALWLLQALRGRRRALKPLLLDQSFLAGLGNIYVDEALHRARLHPLRISHKLSAQAVTRLWAEIRATLSEAIEREGSSFDRFYRTPEGQPGSYQHQFQVYGRQGQACKSCGSTVVKFTVAQRGTHICRSCQRAPRRVIISRP